MRYVTTLTAVIGFGLLAACGGCQVGRPAAADVPSADFYVATTGNDAWSGTLPAPNAEGTDGPFASLERARDAMREKKSAPGPAGAGLSVVIRGGMYPCKATLTFGKEDSGTAESPVTYRGCPGETVRLSGGVQIPGSAFKPVADASVRNRLPAEARDVVVEVNLKALGIEDLGGGASKSNPELFVNGQAMHPARWPNEGWVRTGKVIDRGSVWGSNVPGDPPLREKPDRGAIFVFDNPRVERWKDAEDLWLFGFWWWDWADQAVKVASLDVEKHIIKTVQPHNYGYRTKRRFYAFNLLEEIDVPGEYFLNRETGVLYLYPPCELADADVAFSQLKKPMIDLKDASYVTIRDLTLETSRGTVLFINGGESNRVVACTIRRIAGGAVSVRNGTGHHVSACDIYDVNGGVSLVAGDRKTLTPGKHVVENCHIYRYSRLSKTYVTAIALHGVGLTARHNLIHDAPHMAIGFSGNDHLMEFNDIYNVCQETSDAGVIYAGRNWTMRGHVLRHNFIHDIIGIGGCGAQGMYLDDCFSSATMIGNVFYRMNDLAFLIGGGRDNVIVNNIAVETGPVRIDSRGLGWAKRNAGPGGGMEKSLKKMPYKEEPWASRYPKLVNILEDEPPVPKGNIVQRNVFVRTPSPRLDKVVRENGTVSDNWVTLDDPGFVNAVAMDFRLKPDAEVFKQIPGFEAIPFEKIGLYRCADRPALPPFTPSISPSACAFVGNQTVEIASRTQDAAIHYTTDGSAPTRQSPRYTGPITLTDSTTLRAVAFTGTAKQGCQSSILSAHYEAMQLNSEDGVPLSRLPILSYTGYCEPKRDSNMSAALISLGGKTYHRGLLIHPGETPKGGRGSAEFAMVGGLSAATRLKATVGIDGTQRTRGSVVFIVEGRRNGTWQELCKSPVMKGGKPPTDVEADVSGCDRVRLVVTDAGDNIHCDHAAWGDVRFTAP